MQYETKAKKNEEKKTANVGCFQIWKTIGTKLRWLSTATALFIGFVYSTQHGTHILIHIGITFATQ